MLMKKIAPQVKWDSFRSLPPNFRANSNALKKRVFKEKCLFSAQPIAVWVDFASARITIEQI